MSALMWVIVAVVAAAVGFAVGRSVASGRTARRYQDAIDEVEAALRSGHLADPLEPGELARLGEAVQEAWVPRGSERDAAMRAALSRVAEYLRSRVAEPLGRSLASKGGDLRDTAEGAVAAVEDLEFFVVEAARDDATHNLTRAVQEVSREYARDFDVLVKVRAPEAPIRARFTPESLKDALFLVLVNAGRFGKGEPVDVTLRQEGREARILVQDLGPGFSHEALQRAMDPFYTTEPGSLGLGLPHARGVIRELGGDIWLRNRKGGGGEVEVSLPVAG